MQDQHPPQPPRVPSLSTSLFRGTLWMFAMRWAIRFVGLISLVIVARLLDKQDFGLVAVANSIAALPVTLLDFGLETAIIRETDTSPGVYNTAWSIRVLQMTVAASIVLIFGRSIAHFYGDPRIAQAIPILALSIWIQGFENTWFASFRKNLNFRVDFAYNTSVKVVMTIANIALAFSLRSYWALVYAQVIGALFRTALSFAISPHLPRPTFSHLRSLWSFSQWSLVRSLADYAAINVDRLILGRITNAGQVGAYTLGREIADVPLTEISGPANRALGPGFAKLQGDPRRLAQALTQALGAIAIVAFPVGLGLAAISPNIVPLLLGKGWSGAVPVVQIMALSSLIGAIRGVLGHTLAIIGHFRVVATLQWIRALVLVLAGIPASMLAGPLGMAATFGLAEIVTNFAQAYYFRRHVPDFKLRSLGVAIVRPSIGATIMLGLVLALGSFGSQSTVTQLLIQLTVGACAYVVVILALWQFSGRPNGPESVLLGQLHAGLRLFRPA
jgi:O-antigen/teichoic acid export membrane protein